MKGIFKSFKKAFQPKRTTVDTENAPLEISIEEAVKFVVKKYGRVLDRLKDT